MLVLVVSMLACHSNDKEENAESRSDNTFDMQKARAFIDSINAKWIDQIKNGDSAALPLTIARTQKC